MRMETGGKLEVGRNIRTKEVSTSDYIAVKCD